MRCLYQYGIVFISCLFIFGCSGPQSTLGVSGRDRAVLVAMYTDTPVTIDGRLDEPVWKKAPVYYMNLADDNTAAGARMEEPGRVKLAWDDEYFYIAVYFTDSDIVAEGDRDQMDHFTLGDLAEVFLKPADQTWYWELFATPSDKKSNFFFPGRGRLGVPSKANYDCGLKVAAHCDGTINNWDDVDNGWAAEIAMPIKDLTAHGENFGPDSNWRILVARYNYSRYLGCQGPELTMTPKLSKTNYHFHEEYAELKLTK